MSTDGLTLVLGGASSGKSRWAETEAKNRTDEVDYVATARETDSEVTDKINEHRRRRPDNWKTHEPPHDLIKLQETTSREGIILVDGFGLHLAHRLEASLDPDEILVYLRDWLERMDSPPGWIVVSSLVGRGIVPDYRAGREFRRLVGRANQLLADRADTVVEVVAGIPRFLKQEARDP